ncbi:MAG TPA: DUF1365 domain-containing protein [Kofleriaceae bacterium]|nr:DUF1365 domain-containing protein [Kofleriaceae bacterium]
MRSLICEGGVVHARSGEAAHRLAHRLYFLAVDVDELPALSARLRLFGHNRRAPVAIRDADYLGAAGRGLRAAVEALARAGGVTEPLARIELLTQARVLGFVFNPVSFFLCHDAGGALRCAVAEVANTYGGRHRYLCWAGNRLPGPAATYRVDKTFYVSPYLHGPAVYDFSFVSDGNRRAVRTDVRRPDGELILRARMGGIGRPLDDRALAGALLRHPLMPQRILAAIHWHAWRLRRRGVAHMDPPAHDRTWEAA